MKIIAISDTHIRSGIEELPKGLLDIFKNADMILHSGDFVSLKFYEELSAVCNLKAVAGNMDVPELASILPKKLIIDVEGIKIGLIHGWGSPRETTTNAIKSFDGDDVNIIVFGHAHMPLCEKRGALLLFNPGTLLDKRFSNENSYGMIDVKNGVIKKAAIIKI